MDRKQKSDEVKTKTVLLHQVYREESAIMMKKRKHLIKIMALFLLIIFGGNMKVKAATFCNIENSTPKKSESTISAVIMEEFIEWKARKESEPQLHRYPMAVAAGLQMEKSYIMEKYQETGE